MAPEFVRGGRLRIFVVEMKPLHNIKYFGKQFKSVVKKESGRLGKPSFGEQKSMGKFILEK